MNNEVLNEIFEEYENLRSTEENERNRRVSEIHLKYPEIGEISRNINETGSKTLVGILSSPDTPGLKEEMHSRFKILRQKRTELLKKYGIPEDYDKVKYTCPKCRDTGYVEGEGRCTCFRQRLIDILYKQSNMNELLKKQNFNNFRMDFYSRKPMQGMNKSPYEHMLDVKALCESFIKNFDRDSKSLLFYGDTGLGKTFMSSCIAKDIMDRGKTVVYVRAMKLFRMFEDDRFGRISDGIDEIYNSDLLIIDDLGTESANRNNNSYILELLNDRLSSGKKIIINSNLSLDNMEKQYSKRFTSRLLESFEIVYFYGDDIRKQTRLRN